MAGKTRTPLGSFHRDGDATLETFLHVADYGEGLALSRFQVHPVGGGPNLRPLTPRTYSTRPTWGILGRISNR